MTILPISAGGTSYNVTLNNEQDIQQLAMDVAAALDPGDLVTLSGDLGAGKTTFARALIRLLADDPEIAVPSPSYTLLQTYDLPRFPLVHADLYRLESSGELTELGFDDLPKNAVVLLEWPDRAAGFLPSDRLDVAFTLAPQLGSEHRNVRITGYGAFVARAERIQVIRQFLNGSDFAGAARQRIQGDASTRVYERLMLPERRAILMNAPRRPDGPAVRDGKPYSQIAHLAEDIVPFVAIANGLRSLGYSAPEIYEANTDAGLLLIEDLGSLRFVSGDRPAPITERYAAAVDLLASLHNRKLPAGIRVSPTIVHRLPNYDLGAYLIEAELLLDWYLPYYGVEVTASMREDFADLWGRALQPALASSPTWVLRDFHSPNLIWLPERQGVARVGLIDFQDAVLGSAAYDLASLLQDARVDVVRALERDLLDRYVKQRAAAAANFASEEFLTTYTMLAAQRASKILGIFARLDKRDGKPQYLQHLPRIWAYLQRSLAHSSLTPLKEWYARNVPPPTKALHSPGSGPLRQGIMS